MRLMMLVVVVRMVIQIDLMMGIVVAVANVNQMGECGVVWSRMAVVSGVVAALRFH